MVSRRLYEILGLLCGFVLIDYGFNFVAAGFPGARQLTSQIIGGNLIAGGSAAVFISLYYLLKPVVAATPAVAQPSLGPPDVGVEMIVEEETPQKSGFYRNISYIGYFFTFIGLLSAADLVLQVFIRSIYNEARWWVEILLATFGVLSYTIFVSIGHLGSQEEAKFTGPSTQPKLIPDNASTIDTTATVTPSYAESLEIRVAEFMKSSSGEYERHLSGEVYDMFRIDRDIISVWREDRRGMRSVYLAGPYELSTKLLEEHLKSGEELKIGSLSLSVDSMRELLALQGQLAEGISSATK